MYNQYFGFAEAPFSIAPDPRYLFLSDQHREALAHLLYGIGDQGGFVVLTGEVGTGKTTVCRCLLQQLPEHVDCAFIVNPKLDSRELLESICDELGVAVPEADAGQPSIKALIDALNTFLLQTHARGRNAILIIDEAQNLSVEVLEQLRLLTNLETSERKLLQLILLGQPELNTLLARPDLRQLAQRITARFHLGPLPRAEVALYIDHRLAIAGCRGHLFQPAAVRLITRYSQGVPRVVNLLCDRALLGVYAGSGSSVDAGMVRRAAREVLPGERRWTRMLTPGRLLQAAAVGSAALVLAVAAALYLHRPHHVAPQATVPAGGGAVSAAAAGAETAARGDWRGNLERAGHGAPAALAAIYRAWGRRLDDAAQVAALTCHGADDSRWGCLPLSGQSRQDLQRYDRPVVLLLSAANVPAADGPATNATDTAAPLAAALLHLDDGDALLHFGGRDWTIPWSELAGLWHGAIYLPLPAPVSQLPLKTGATDPLVGWVDDQLYRHYHQNHPRFERNRIDDIERLGGTAPQAAWLASFYLGLHPVAQREQLDAALTAELRRFQQEVGLKGDGAVDLDTVLALIAASAAHAPRLTAIEKPDSVAAGG